MKPINILDTSIGTLNIGDEIIVDSVRRELRKIFPKEMFLNVPTHEKISRYSRKIVKNSKYSFVAGTNILRSDYSLVKSNQWNINFIDAINFENVILMGAGWNSYQKKPSILSKLLYKNALDNKYYHSVRDNYTKKKLLDIGITNVYNTGCPTMWELTKEHCNQIPISKAKNVICTITDYCKDVKNDKYMIDILLKNYDNVYCWVQGSEDFSYIKELSDKVIIVNPTLNEYDNILESNLDIDYVGTRLHAGIRAMQKKRRSIIIGIDNRAIEKKNDFNINVIERNELDKLETYINSNIKTEIHLDFDIINAWRNQFK